MSPLEKKVHFYRGVMVVLLVLLGLLALKLKRIAAQVGDFGAAGETWVVDLDERARVIEEAHGAEADFSETYLATEFGSVHLHAMGHAQVTPLHLHPASDEVTVIASGTAKVTQAWGSDGGVTTRELELPAGSSIASPRFCAHEWTNRSRERMLFNVVFTSPRFSGNFYVHPDDSRILAGGAPSSPRAGAAQILTQLPELSGRLHSLLVDRRWKFPDTRGAPVMVWVQGGNGTAGREPIHANSLVHVEGRDVEFVAEQPLSLLLFDVSGRAFPVTEGR